MTEFDPLKAAYEEMAGLSNVLETLHMAEREAEEALAKAERSLNAVRKLTGYCRIEMDRLRVKISILEQKR